MRGHFSNAVLDERYPFLGLTSEVYFYRIYDRCVAAINIDDVLGLNVLYFESDSKEIIDTSGLLSQYKEVIARIKNSMK